MFTALEKSTINTLIEREKKKRIINHITCNYLQLSLGRRFNRVNSQMGPKHVDHVCDLTNVLTRDIQTHKAFLESLSKAVSLFRRII